MSGSPTDASRFLIGLRLPASAQFLDTDQVARPIAEGTVRIRCGCSVGSSTTSAGHRGELGFVFVVLSDTRA